MLVVLCGLYVQLVGDCVYNVLRAPLLICFLQVTEPQFYVASLKTIISGIKPLLLSLNGQHLCIFVS